MNEGEMKATDRIVSAWYEEFLHSEEVINKLISQNIALRDRIQEMGGYHDDI